MAENENIPIGQKGISKEIAENENDLLEKLQRQASYFLNRVSQAVQDLKKANESFDDKDTQAIYNAARNTLVQAREITSFQYNFQEALNRFLGREIALLWIDEKGNIFYATQVTAKDIYTKGSRKSEGRLSVNISQKQLTELTKIDEKTNLPKLLSFDKYLDDFGDKASLLKDRRDSYKSTKDTVINRWEGNHKPQTKKQKEWYNAEKENGYPYRNTFWWRFNGDYGHSEKMNKGNIYEAYMSIIFDNKSKTAQPFGLSDKETNVRLYWEYMQTRNILNNIPGIVEGDVVFDNIYQYAVKAGSFNTASLGPYIVAAVEILKLSECTPETVKETVLKEIKPNSFRDKIKDEGFKEFVKEVQGVIDSYTTKNLTK